MPTTSDRTTKVDAEYIEVIATRSRRAESLAARIEEGAAGLAALTVALRMTKFALRRYRGLIR
jgi:hypothetical protein